MSRGCFLLLIAGIAAGTVRADDADAIALLESAGAIVTRDEKLADKPVVKVTCHLREMPPEVNRGLQELAALPALELIGSGDTQISVGTLRALQGKKSLKQLSVAFAKVPDECARILGTLKSIEILELRAQTNVSPKGMEDVLNLSNLRELTLSDRLVNDQVLAGLSRQSDLTTLNLRSVFITDEGMKSLRNISGLRKLNLFAGSNVSPAGLRQLAGLELKRLDLIYADVDDEKLKELRKLPSLKTVRLINAVKVTDDSVACLGELTDLTDLDLSNASLSKAGVQQLKQALPKCNVTIDARPRN